MTLDDFENLVCQTDYEAAGKAFFQILLDLENNTLRIVPEEDKVLLKAYTRVACAMSYLLSNPKFQLSKSALISLLTLQRCFQAVFAASVFEDPDELITKITRPLGSDGDDRRQLVGEQQVTKLLAVYSLDSAIELNFKVLLAEYPDQALPAYLSLISTLTTLTPKAQQSRENFLTYGPDLENVPLPEALLPLMTNAWMLCSYALSDSKHDIKRHMNAMIRKMLIQSKVSAPALPAQRKLKSRPIMLLPLEAFQSNHAMYRVYAPAVRQLKGHFELVALTRTWTIDDQARKLFDQVIAADKLNIRAIVGRIIKLGPDVIYYPSLGMADFTLALANLRLAPIQLYTVGHPATTHSDCIDYVVNEAKWAGDPETHSETTIHTPARSFAFDNRAAAENIEAAVNVNPEVIRIALAARVYKLNASLLLLLQRAMKRAKRKAEVHFFPNELGVHLFATKRKILDILPDAVIHPRTDYQTYIRRLNDCDIQLGTYPFGGTNSNIDSLKRGLPLVTREGKECHSRTDAAMMREVGLPDWLITHSEEEWEDTLVRLIEEDEERVRLSHQLIAADFDSIFFADPENPGTGFVDTLKWIYENHEKIRQDGRKLWTVEARSELI